MMPAPGGGAGCYVNEFIRFEFIRGRSHGRTLRMWRILISFPRRPFTKLTHRRRKLPPGDRVQTHKLTHTQDMMVQGWWGTPTKPPCNLPCACAFVSHRQALSLRTKGRRGFHCIARQRRTTGGRTSRSLQPYLSYHLEPERAACK